ncbi:MAG: hypothetical protein OHK0015_21590 [Chloroflexi bacterium OHK40]
MPFDRRQAPPLTPAAMASLTGTVGAMASRTLKGFEAPNIICIGRGAITVVGREVRAAQRDPQRPAAAGPARSFAATAGALARHSPLPHALKPIKTLDTTPHVDSRLQRWYNQNTCSTISGFAAP